MTPYLKKESPPYLPIMKKREKVLLPGGIDNFHKLITHRDPAGNKVIFVDKTCFIKDFLESSDDITLITRPRRFGKTLTLSMLQHFLAAEVNGKETKGLFDGLNISKHPETMRYQGQHPVIFLTFKEAKGQHFEQFFSRVKEVIRNLYRTHRHLLNNGMEKDDRLVFERILNKEATQSEYENSLKALSGLLQEHTGKNVYILLDEYDTPINDSYVHNYYEECRDFLAAMFAKTFKGNNALERGLITGILKIAKASLFSGMNNLEVYTMLDDARHPHYFGFTERETDDYLDRAGLPQKAHDLKEMYKGYELEGHTLFNPFSIVSFIKKALLLAKEEIDKALQPYWINTGGTHLIGDLLRNNLNKIKRDFTSLLNQKPIKTPINENIIFNPNLKNDSISFWSLLLLAGYVKSVKREKDEFNTYIHTISFPNDEIRFSMRELLLNVSFGRENAYTMIAAMTQLSRGHVDDFVTFVRDYLRYSISYFDRDKEEPEKPYRLLLLGMAAFYANTHHIRSERESGDGRYDISLEPKNTDWKGIIIELKAAKEGENLKEEAQKAYDQIITRGYKTDMESRGIKDFVLLGMAFRRKEIDTVSNEKPEYKNR